MKEVKNERKKIDISGKCRVLLFWLLFVPPIGVVWLIFNMKTMEINTDKEGEIRSFKYTD
ncbi:MAG: hypothetical protein KJ858_05890 [Nanoarchaeota archaeon]|nr:hypothetical protein [Nanoarchaeota archaeon]